MSDKGSEKKQRLLSALDQGMVMIHLDARRPGVSVPANLKSEVHLRLNLSYRFDPPDLSVGDWGIRSTLSFSGKRFTVAVPWSALFAITSHVTHEFWLYPEDMPAEVIQAGLKAQGTPKEEPAPRAADGLREVAAEAGPAPKDERAEQEPEEPKPRGRGHLRVVK